MKKLTIVLLMIILPYSFLLAGKIHIYLTEGGVESFTLSDISSISLREEPSLLTTATMYLHLSDADSVGFATSNIERLTFSDNVSAEDISRFVSNIPIKSLKNFPNPFNPDTIVSFEIGEGGKGAVEIFNAKGQLIKTLLKGELIPGTHHLKWCGTNKGNEKVSSGVYFYRVTVNDYQTFNKMIMIK